MTPARVNSRPELISARRLKRKEKNTGQLQVHRQLPCYDFCLEAEDDVVTTVLTGDVAAQVLDFFIPGFSKFFLLEKPKGMKKGAQSA